MTEDVKVLRTLAWDYFGIATSVRNAESLKLHRAVNDLKQIRPVVLVNELPWSELNIDDELTLRCNDSYLREIERFMRMSIYRSKYMPGDMVVPRFIPVHKIVRSSGIGISVEEDILPTDKNNNIVAHRYKDILQNEEDLEKLQHPVLTYDREETMRRYGLVGEILGDILPVKVTGSAYLGAGPWDSITQFRGPTNMLTDLADRPDFMHRTVQKLTDITLCEWDQMEALDLLDDDPWDLHCTALCVSDLPGNDFDGEKLTRKNVWGRGAAQIFGAVSKAMHEEFEIEYAKQTIGQCGLVYYGCCEPLDNKIDIVEKIPHLRKISITPWADVDVAAEAINTRYVLASKPNPAAVAAPTLDEDGLRKELGKILDACKRNNCSCDIVLKDVSTCCRRPQNLFRWEQIAMEMVQNY